jgi:ABC-type polysaccharide/polyol phosphate transport system ATPase subunit/GNAT superfamily N-acetyltransferase
VIEIIDVSKKFRIWEDRSRDLKETTINFLRGKKRSFREVWALQGIDLVIKEGETVAFIGENGSGKSTLLKLLGGIYSPDEGKIVTRGKISTLFDLGVGFHPDLTGEENIYLNGAMLGFDRAAMREKFDAIVSFSEIEDFIYSPIRTYSSGMLMRLGFSVAMCVNPDILLLDEVLAVGDEAFQNKCLERLETFKTSGKTIVLVSHGMEMVRKFCERAILLHGGRILSDDVPEKTIQAYHHLLYGEESQPTVAEDHKTEESHPDEISIKERAESPIPFDGEQTEEDGGAPSPKKLFKEEVVNESLEKAPLDTEKIRIIEVQDPSFFAEHLFRDAFGHSPPQGPSNYVALYSDSGSPSDLKVIGFVHLERVGEMGLVGGVCVDRQWRGRGIGKKLLISVDEKRREEKALFVHTDNPTIASACGYETLPHPYLMVKWMEPLSEEEKARIAGAAWAFGPF